MATSLMMAGIIRSHSKDLKKKSVRFALPENLRYLQDRCIENGGRNDDRSFWLSPISGAYYDWLQRNTENNYSSQQSVNDVDMVFQDTVLDAHNFREEPNLQLPASPTESMQEIGSLASDATFTVSSPQKCPQCNKLEQTISSILKEKEGLLEKLGSGEEEINCLRNKVRELEDAQKEIENSNNLILQKVKFLENNLSQGQSEQAQLQVKLAEARAKLTMVLSGKEHLLRKRTKSSEQQEIDAEETKAQMDLLRSEIERLSVSSSRVDVLSSTIQIYKDRITELQKLVETNARKKQKDAQVQVGERRAINRWNKSRTRIPLLIRKETKQIENCLEENDKKKIQIYPEFITPKPKRAWLDKDSLIINLREEIANIQYERDKALEKINQNSILEEQATEIRLELENQIRTLQEKNAALIECCRKETILRKKFCNMVENMKGRVRVYCRIRPLSQGETQKNSTCIIKSPDRYTISVNTPRGVKEYQFDGIFTQHHNQQDVFKDTEDLIRSVVDGYNVSLFGYGQTGSGKTYTLIGSREEPGIAIRAFYKIFDLIEEYNVRQAFTVSASILELYNDTLIDLLKNRGTQEEKLDIKKYQDGRVYVQGATKIEVLEAEQLMTLFHNACNNRHTSATKMNMTSSRSHLIITTSVESNDKLTGTVLKGKNPLCSQTKLLIFQFSVIDLAGSERVGKSAAVGNQLKEANSINKSLSALADVIAALITDQSYIPYRNNKLTQLMQDSLGGNSKTLMFVNISPSECNLEETLISLAYASRVKQVTNEALQIRLKSRKCGQNV